MPWNDSSQTIVGSSGQLYTAAVGSTLPTTESASLAAATWTGLGYAAEEGVRTNKTLEIDEHKAWQAANPIRRARGEEAFQLGVSLLQWNETNVPLVFGGGAVTNPTGSTYKFTPPEDEDALPEKALVCDIIDGSVILRFIVPRATITEGVETQFARNQMAPLPVTLKALEPETGGAAWSFFTNSPDFATGS